MYKNAIILILHKLFLKLEEMRSLPNSFYEANTLILKPDKDNTRKETLPQ